MPKDKILNWQCPLCGLRTAVIIAADAPPEAEEYAKDLLTRHYPTHTAQDWLNKFVTEIKAEKIS